jgi:uncharacterized membrane protein
MTNQIIYTVDGDNLKIGYFSKLENAEKMLEGMAYVKRMSLDVTDNCKAVYTRETDGMFGAPKTQTAYIGFITTED